MQFFISHIRISVITFNFPILHNFMSAEILNLFQANIIQSPDKQVQSKPKKNSSALGICICPNSSQNALLNPCPKKCKNKKTAAHKFMQKPRYPS